MFEISREFFENFLREIQAASAIATENENPSETEMLLNKLLSQSHYVLGIYKNNLYSAYICIIRECLCSK